MIVDLVKKVTSGDLSHRLSTGDKSGIFAEVCEQVNQLVDGIDNILGDVIGRMQAFAGGDLRQQKNKQLRGTFLELSDSVNGAAVRLADTVMQIKGAAAGVEMAAAEIADGAMDLSSRNELTTTNLRETSSLIEQMSVTVRQNAENAKGGNQLAEIANETASKGEDVVERAIAAMSGIEKASDQINDIISVIDEIAFQTNLLALNASVEAARAGEAGKGFAVVAQEVRQLAQRSAQAASDIKTLIQGSNGQVKEGVDLVNKAGEALSDIVGAINKVSGIVLRISDASQGQASGIEEINASVSDMGEMTQQNSALVERSSASARALTEQASGLAKLISLFKLDNAEIHRDTRVPAS